MLKPRFVIIFAMAVFCLTGCSLIPSSPSSANRIELTSIYETVAVQLTETAQAGSLAKTNPAPPKASPGPLPTLLTITVKPDLMTPLPPSATLVCDRVAPGKPTIDVSFPDGAQVLPGQPFTKTWRLVNSGSCAWTRDYAVVWFSGDPFGGVKIQFLTNEVKPGQSMDVSIEMTSPLAAGIYQSNWMIRNPTGHLFGLGPANSAPFWARIEVMLVRTSTSTALPSSTSTPTVIAVSRGSITLGVEKALDLDTGKVVGDASADLGIQAGQGDALLLTPINGATFDPVGNLPPAFADCKGAALKSDPIPLGVSMTGMHLCYRTNLGLPGYIVIKAIQSKEKNLSLEFVTWAVP